MPLRSAILTIGIDTPASAGVPGPGEMSTPSNSLARRSSSPMLTASLRITCVVAPSCCR
jgi:hypothetical protein